MAVYTSGEYVISLALSCHSKDLKQRMDQHYSSVLQLSFIWQAKENTSSRCEGGLTQKTLREEKYPCPLLSFGFSFYMFSFLLPPGLPYVNRASKEGCLFYLRFSLWGSRTFLCSIFMGFSLPSLLATAILDSFFLF